MKKPLSIAFLGSGRYSDVFRVSNGHYVVIMKLSYYRDNTLQEFVHHLKNGHADAARAVKNSDAIMVSHAFASITNGLIKAKRSPHFVYVYCNADCHHMTQRLAPLLPDRMKNSTPTQLKYNNISFMEQFTSDMTKWIRGRSKDLTDETLRTSLFGVLYTLEACQRQFPGFRHNDLSTNNVLIKRTKPMTLGYKMNRFKFMVTTPILVALCDYDFTHVPNHKTLQNERVVSGKYKVTEHPNPTYDTHFFLKTVQKNLKGQQQRSKFPQTVAFLQSLPFKSEDRLDTTPVPGMEPSILIRHNYFKPLRVRHIPSNVETYSTT
jgi:hypothetical protein